MASVTQIASSVKQPRNGFVPISEFEVERFEYESVFLGEYSIAPGIVGLAVDYGTRLALGLKPLDVFSAALEGARLASQRGNAIDLLESLDLESIHKGDFSDKDITTICRLSGYDGVARSGARLEKPVNSITPDASTRSDIRELISRTTGFFDEHGPVISEGFTFEGGLTDSATAGDGDYLTADTLWDLKTSKRKPGKDETLQVVLYYLMGLRSGKEEFKNITKVGIYNPRLKTAWVKDVLSIDEDVLKTIMTDLLGYDSRHGSGLCNYASISLNDAYYMINWIRETAETEREKGDKFERAARYYLKNDPIYRQRFSEVWMWKDAPTNNGADLGIDLVALDAEDGTYWAIQCKCYQKPMLDYKDVATFYGTTGASDVYKHNMIITTCQDFGPNLDKVASQWGTVRVFLDDMNRSDLDWLPFVEGKGTAERKFYEPMPHQREAIDACLEKFQEFDRGQLIMACGTGKTLTSLRLTEELLPEGSLVLFLAPSIALVSQTMRVWANQSKRDIRCAVVCSDSTASSAEGDTWETSLADIPYPATTNPEDLYNQIKRFNRDNGVNVVFSTYQSIQVVSDAQRKGLDPFDLIVCDEAHRTTGANEATGNLFDQSAFTKVHDNAIVSAYKRIYMTATPKLYGDKAKVQAKKESYEISSMDDESKFGPVFYRLTFGRAVDEGLLTDYRVIVLTVSEDVVSEVYQRAMAEDEGFEITDAAKIIGCWKGLIDQGKKDGSGHALSNAVAFCSTIPESKRMSSFFERTVNAYIDYEKEQGNDMPMLRCKIDHVDGTMDMAERKRKLDWLRNADYDEEDPDSTCHVLSNVRCLSEGVDVPNLDAIMFLQPKKSRVEVVQAVGRVMRKFEGKEFGYIILPVVVPAGMTPDEALDQTDAFKVVWEIVQALRSHDERLDGSINSMEYDMATTAVIEVINIPKEGSSEKGESGSGEEGGDVRETEVGPEQLKLDFTDQELQEAVNAVIVKKCGTRVYWEDWAKDIGAIAKRHIERVGELVLNGGPASGEFAVFLKGLRDSLNEGITESEAVEMLAQHMITLPVFEALFAGAEFASSNPVSIAMEGMVETLSKYGIETPAEKRELAQLYSDVRLRASSVKTDAGRQKIIKELYEKFFSQAFKATSEKMGIVYTPNEVVNYILHATDRLMEKEFGQRLADEGVHILDPFTGTGTFMVNLLQDKQLMPDEKLPYKYANELHCNEILLLAYYIATINIEHAYHSRVPGEYVPFEGAVLTDTFQMYEEGDSIDVGTFVDNTERILKQMETPINVIVGNPPYSAKQGSANDNNENMAYPTLDGRIARTYVAKSAATNSNAVYDSYIRSFRWASERIGGKGIVAFVTNGSWLDGSSFDGFRKCLVEEFSSIYVFNLRGNARTSGEQRRKEKDNVFGQGTRTPICITMLVKNPDSSERGTIHYHDIGDYLTREEKLNIVQSSIASEPFEWNAITPDRHGDWLNQRDDMWYEYAPLGLEKFKLPEGIFIAYSLGVATGRDVWVWGYSKHGVRENIKAMIDFFNGEVERYQNEGSGDPKDFVTMDQQRISWNRNLLTDVKKGNYANYCESTIQLGLYRPFCKQWIYAEKQMLAMTYQIPKLYPRMEIGNYSIVMPSTPKGGFSCLVTNALPDLNIMSGGTQCFPLYWYEKQESTGGLFDEEDASKGGYTRHDAITDEALRIFRNAYPNAFPNRFKKDGGTDLTKEDIFYYVYGILHSPEYRERFDANLKKELPRIPLANDFAAFANAGRGLARLHLEYENLEPWPVVEMGDSENPGPVEKIRWGKKKDLATGKKVDDHTALIYNGNLTIKEIPEAAQRYVVNGRSPLEWVVDRYQVKTDKASGIVNDPNEYSDDPRYIVDLIEKLIRVSMETMEIVDSLPPLQEKPQPADWPFAWKADSI